MTTYPVRTHEMPPWYPLAGEAMTATADRRYADAAAAIQRINDEYGPDTVVDLCTALADTALHAQGVEDYGPGVRLVFGHRDTGKLATADDVPALIATAGRLIAARAANDPATFMALLGAAQSAGELGPLVGALLFVATTTTVMFTRAGNRT